MLWRWRRARAQPVGWTFALCVGVELGRGHVAQLSSVAFARCGPYRAVVLGVEGPKPALAVHQLAVPSEGALLPRVQRGGGAPLGSIHPGSVAVPLCLCACPEWSSGQPRFHPARHVAALIANTDGPARPGPPVHCFGTRRRVAAAGAAAAAEGAGAGSEAQCSWSGWEDAAVPLLAPQPEWGSPSSGSGSRSRSRSSCGGGDQDQAGRDHHDLDQDVDQDPCGGAWPPDHVGVPALMCPGALLGSQQGLEVIKSSSSGIGTGQCRRPEKDAAGSIRYSGPDVPVLVPAPPPSQPPSDDNCGSDGSGDDGGGRFGSGMLGALRYLSQHAQRDVAILIFAKASAALTWGPADVLNAKWVWATLRRALHAAVGLLVCTGAGKVGLPSAQLWAC